MDAVEYLAYRVVYIIIAFIVGAVPLFMLIGLAQSLVPAAVAKPVGKCGMGLVFVWLLFANWVASNAAHRRAVLGQPFIGSLFDAFDEGRGSLGLLWFTIQCWFRGTRDAGRHDGSIEPK